VTLFEQISLRRKVETSASASSRPAVDRKDFGLKWNQVLEAGGVLVGDRVDIELEVQAVKAAAVQAA
jgi:polyisoprenoid-binding protein YceI